MATRQILSKSIYRFGRDLHRPLLALAIGTAILLAALYLWTDKQVRIVEEAEFVSATTENVRRVQFFYNYLVLEIEFLEEQARHISNTLIERPSAEVPSYSAGQFERSAVTAMVVRGDNVETVVGPLSIPEDVKDDIGKYHITNGMRGYISPPYISQSGTPFVVFHSAKNIRKSPEFSILLAIESKELMGFSYGLSFSDEDLISLIGLDGLTRARRINDKFSAGESVEGGLVMQEQLENPNGTYIGPNSLTGVESIFSHRRLSEYEVFATSGMTIEKISSAALAKSRVYLLWATVATFLVLATAIWAARSLLRQRRGLKELRRQLNRLRAAQRLGRVGDWEYYPETETFTFSRVLREAYALPPKPRYRFSDIASVLTAHSATVLRKALYEVLTFAQPKYVELQLRNAAPETSHREVTIAPVISDGGALEQLHGVDRDISREKRIADLRVKMGLMSRLDALSALAATIVHELRQPMTAAKTYLAAAKRHISRNDITEAEPLIDRSMKQIDFASQIIQNAGRDLGPSDEIDLGFDVKQAVHDTEEALRALYQEKDIEVSLSIEEGAEQARGTHSQAKQIFFNLMKNSAEATPDGIPTKIFVHAQELPNKRVKILLLDNGSGIPDLEDPFSLFTSGKSDGMGLGMAITKTIIENLGGSIHVESTGPSGSEICFELPAAKDRVGGEADK